METQIDPVIAIVGAGPAGLTAVVILHRDGHQVQVYEAGVSNDHLAQGETLDLHQDTGQVALERAGLLASFRAVARDEDQEQRSIDPFSGEPVVGAGFPDAEADRPESTVAFCASCCSMLYQRTPFSVAASSCRLRREPNDRTHCCSATAAAPRPM